MLPGDICQVCNGWPLPFDIPRSLGYFRDIVNIRNIMWKRREIFILGGFDMLLSRQSWPCLTDSFMLKTKVDPHSSYYASVTPSFKQLIRHGVSNITANLHILLSYKTCCSFFPLINLQDHLTWFVYIFTYITCIEHYLTSSIWKICISHSCICMS